MIATAGHEAADCDLVSAVRAGDDSAFEELYRRYQARIAGFVRGMLHDDGRAEDVAQETFLSALRRIRAADQEINFKPWIYQIARNAAIDSYRRTSHAVEVSMDADDGLRTSDRHRLVGIDGGPDAALVTKEQLNHLQGAFDELSDVHSRVLVMRELEGMSYREIGKQLHLTRPAVESALFRARRRLESEYAELSEGRRCEAMHATIARMVEGTHRGAEEHRLARHVKRCSACRRRASELGIRPLTTIDTLRRKAAALLPIPWLFRRSGGDGSHIAGMFSSGAAPLAERAAALAAAAALVGAGGAALGTGALRGDHGTAGGSRPAAERSDAVRGESQRGTTGPAADGERAKARRASGRGASGPAGGRAGGSNEASESLTPGARAPSAETGGSGAAGDGPTRSLPSLDRTRSLPSLDRTPLPPPPPTKLELKTPEISTPDAGPAVPKVQVPEVPVEVQLPSVESVTDGLQDGLQGALP